MLQNFWNDFLKTANRLSDTKYAGVICFGMDAAACENAVERILSGKMCCRIYPANGYRKAMSGEARVGDLNIVTNWKGEPCAVIETAAVHVMPVSDLTDEICAQEGVQENLAAWREKQLPFIKTEVEELGGELNDATPITVEEFKTVYPIS